MKIIIGFKNGKELPIICDSFTTGTSSVSGKLVSYDIKGLKGKVIPNYIDINDISYIYKEVTENEGETE